MEVKTIADKLVNKRLVDIDALMSYLENDTDLGYASDFMASLQIAVDNFIATTVPDVDVGQTVFVITDGNWNKESQKYDKCIIKGYVHKKTIKKRYTFSVRKKNNDGHFWCGGTYTVNSIGKTVFFTEEDAKKALEKEK